MRMAECHPDRKHYGNGLCKLCCMKKWRAENPQYLERNKKQKADRRKRAMDILGDKCECCGESNYEFLSVDHIDGGGKKHFARDGWYKVIGDVMKHPEKYRILCRNCNWSWGAYGYCPHLKEE